LTYSGAKWSKPIAYVAQFPKESIVEKLSLRAMKHMHLRMIYATRSFSSGEGGSLEMKNIENAVVIINWKP
jgi:hypothetical protein